ncbi:GNAT family N-acetyltransferase [Kurthia senegalensis]|uniref:GNAT family N-acetyltransferase n=1 Tax=Kurthia senegalensis TaxID=1033740 RepID=UPI000287D8B3|nr:GNAT family N-acetyltransferase [Kurthia senegalensis]
MTWYVKTFDELTTIELYTLLKERTDVFVVEQNCPYPEIDGKDIQSYHLYKMDGDEIVAYARLLPKGVSYEEASIGRVLVKKTHRGQGLAQELLTRSLAYLEQHVGETTIKIQAQDYLRDFYGSFGFQAISETYLEDNIPHVDMLRIKR